MASITSSADIKQPNTTYISSLILFCFSLLYLYSEVVFNVLMLDIAGTSSSSMKEVEDIQYYGRMISASGFTLLLLGLFDKTGFRLSKTSHWLIAFTCIFICSIPFLMIFGESLYRTIAGKDPIEAGFDFDMGWALMVVPGAMLFLLSGGHNRALIAIGLIIMAWPAMFFGQKILIERYIVAPTSWQDRLSARYVLMARSQSEECRMQLGTLNLCKRNTHYNENLRSLNAVLAAILLNAKKSVMTDISYAKDDAILKEIMASNSSDIDASYIKYLYQVNKIQKFAYNQFTKDKNKFIKNFYTPYMQASRRYEQAVMLQPRTSKKAHELWRILNDKKDIAWQQYLMETSNYNTSIDSIAEQIKEALTKIRAEAYDCDDFKCETNKRLALKEFQHEHNEQANIIDDICGGNPLEYSCKITTDEIALKIHEEKDKEFIEKSGYTPDIATKQEFFALPKNQAILKEQVKETLSSKIKGVNYNDIHISDNITEKELVAIIQNSIIKRANFEWSTRMKKLFKKDIAPSLPMTKFFLAMGVNLPPESSVKINAGLNRPDFMKQYVLPEYKAKVVKYFDDIEKEAPDYANKEKLSEQGKNYVRAVYIPPIALGLSLLIVALTIGKNIIFIGSSIIYVFMRKKQIPKYISTIAYIVTWLGFIGITSTFINQSENFYTKNRTYKKYYEEGMQKHPTITLSLDAIIRIQPSIYIYGNTVLKHYR